MLQLRPTFSESWYRVVNLKPRLRATAQISRQFYRGDRWYVVRDPAGNQFHRLSDAAYKFVGLLDGRRTVGEAWELVGGQLEDDAPTQPEVIQILSQLFSANLVETDISPDATVLLRRHKKQMQRKMQGRLMNVLFPRIPVWDPNRFLTRWMPVVKPFLSKAGAILWIVMVISAVAALVPHWTELKTAASDSIDPANWFYLWLTFVLIKFIHELGHAFTCRRFGGEVHEMGIMFLVMVPTPYVDASTAWAFPNKWARMLVGAGGMMVELFFASIMAFVWLATKDSHTIVSQLSYNAMLIASVTTVIFNANPLLRYDGYYMLSDFWEIPNLQQKSKDYAMGLLKRHVFRVKSQQPLPPPFQRAQLFFYALASGAYRMFVGIAIIIMVAFKIPVLGYLMAIGGVVTWLGVPIYKISKYLAIDPELHRKRTPAIAFTLGVAVALVVLIGLIPFPVNVDATGMVEPSQKFVLNVLTPGFVQSIAAKDGQLLKKGDVILVCSDDQLDSQIAQQHAKIASAEDARQAASVSDQAQREIEEETIKALQGQLDDLLRHKDEQTIRAPIDGYLVAPKLADDVGRWLPRGEEVATVAQLQNLEIDGVLDQREGQLAINQPDAHAELRLSGDPGVTLYPVSHLVIPEATFKVTHPSLTQRSGGDLPPDPTDKTGLGIKESAFEVIATVSNPESKYLPGQRAYLRLKLQHKPLLWQWTRKFLQLIQTRQQNPLV
jgi:putative peptide zinc metalloprotease protein